MPARRVERALDDVGLRAVLCVARLDQHPVARRRIDAEDDPAGLHPAALDLAAVAQHAPVALATRQPRVVVARDLPPVADHLPGTVLDLDGDAPAAGPQIPHHLATRQP